MALMRWNDSLSVNIESIDKQHKEFVNILNEFNQLISSGFDKADLGVEFNKLIEYAKTHFSYEEKYMKEFNYVLYEKHRSIHIDFIHQLVDFSKKINSGSNVVIFEIVKYMEKWVVDHIKGDDHKYVACFKRNGLT